MDCLGGTSMRIEKIFVLVAAFALSGCASSYPPLVSIPPVPPVNEASLTEVDRALRSGYWLQDQYALGYQESAQFRDASQIPIFVAAAIAGLILLDNDANPTDAARFGVVTGAYTGIRDQLASPGLVDAYIAGHGALTCVLAEGSNFAGADAQSRFNELDNLLQDLANAMAALMRERWTEPTNAASQAEALRLARQMADQAVAAARTAETAALIQQSAYRGAGTVFRGAISSISVRVASRARVRPPVPTLPNTPPAPKTDNAVDTQSDPSNEVAAVIQRIITKTNGLITVTARLNSGMPNYSESLARVAACPNQI
jgi:hypothetical protein